VLEGFGFQSATGAGGIGVRRPPGRVGGQIAFSGSHLVNSPCNEFAQAHKRPRMQCGGVQIVSRGWEKRGPFHEERLPNPLLQGGVSAVHQGLGREGGGRAHEVRVDHGHPGWPAGEGYGPVSYRIHRQVVPYRWDRAGSFPVSGKVNGRQAPGQGPRGVRRSVHTPRAKGMRGEGTLLPGSH